MVKQYREKARKVITKSILELKKEFSEMLDKLYKSTIDIGNSIESLRQLKRAAEDKPLSFTQKVMNNTTVFKNKLKKYEVILKETESCLEILNELNEEYFQDQTRCTDVMNISKRSLVTGLSSKRDLTNFFDNVSFLGDNEEEIPLHIWYLFIGLGVFITVLFFTIFFFGKR